MTDFFVGQISKQSILVTEKLIERFADLTGDRNPIHFGGDGAIAHALIAQGLISRILGERLPGPGTKIIRQEIDFTAPVLVNSNLRIEVTIDEIEDRKMWLAVEGYSNGCDSVLNGYCRVLTP